MSLGGKKPREVSDTSRAAELCGLPPARSIFINCACAVGAASKKIKVKRGKGKVERGKWKGES